MSKDGLARSSCSRRRSFAGSSAAAPADPFAGAWVGVESPVGDGSTDYMSGDGHIDAGGVIFSRIGSHSPLAARTRVGIDRWPLTRGPTVVTSTRQHKTRTSPA